MCLFWSLHPTQYKGSTGCISRGMEGPFHIKDISRSMQGHRCLVSLVFLYLPLMTTFHFKLWTQEQRCTERQMLEGKTMNRQQGLGCHSMYIWATEYKHGGMAGSWAVNMGCARRSCINMIRLAADTVNTGFLQKRLKEVGLFSLEKRRLRGISSQYSYILVGWLQRGWSVFLIKTYMEKGQSVQAAQGDVSSWYKKGIVYSRTTSTGMW